MRTAHIGFLLAILMTAPSAVAGEVVVERYPWLGDADSLPPMAALDDRFAAPEGYTRVSVAKGSHASWLRGLPVRTDHTVVRAYNGDSVVSPAAAVVVMDVGKRDLQQCADSAIRLHAEWLWSAGREDEAGYHFTSGDLSRWEDYKDGEQFVIKGARVDRVEGKARSDSHRSFRSWLDLVFTYAGTRSLARDSVAVATSSDLQAGDFFVQSGSPGHAVVILDVAESASGDRVALIGQGFMPAQDFHVLSWPAVALDDVWFPLPETADGLVRTPSWSPFKRIEARRFK
jgi:hypothetical protein